MSNTIKYNTSNEPLSLKKGNFYIGTGDVGKGPSESTGFYNGITPPVGGYTIYTKKTNQGPSIRTANNSSELIKITNEISGVPFTSETQCLTWFSTQSDYIISNRTIEPIITNGLVFNMDAGYTPSYPKSGSFLGDISNNNYYQYSVKNVGIPLNQWYVLRSDISEITDGSITPPFSGAQIWSSTINTSLYANTLHRTWPDGSVKGIIGNLGQGFYRYYMWVRGKSTNSVNASIYIDISDGGLPGNSGNVVIGTNENWQLVSCWDNGGSSYNASKFFDYQLNGVNGDTFYISSIVIARFDSPDASGLVKLYPFPGYINYSGTTNVNLQGVFVNGPSFNDNYGGSILFDGIDDNLDFSTIPQQFFTGTTDYSIDIWVNQKTRQGGYRMPISTENTIAVGRDGVNIAIYSANTTENRIIHERFGTDTQVATSLIYPFESVVNTPINIVATYGSNKLKIYVNGSGSTENTTTANITNTTTSVRLGSRGSGSGNFFNGEIYTTRIYNRALSSSEVLQNYNSQKTRFGL